MSCCVTANSAYLSANNGHVQVYAVTVTGPSPITDDAVDAKSAVVFRSDRRVDVIRFDSGRVWGNPHTWHCDIEGKCLTELPPDGAGGVVHYIPSTGQSLDIASTDGQDGALAGGQPYPYDSLMFNTGVRLGGSGQSGQSTLLSAGSLTALVPLMERLDLTDGACGETAARSFAAYVQGRTQTRVSCGHRMLLAAHGIGGAEFAVIKKGGTGNAYANLITSVTKAKTLAEAAPGGKFIVPAVRLVHGERDAALGTSKAAYKADIFQLYTDMNTDILAITGQATPVHLILCQMNSWTQGGIATSDIPIAQLEACTDPSYPNIHLVGPKYQLGYTDGQHLNALGQSRNGQNHALVYEQAILDKSAFNPTVWSALVPVSTSFTSGSIVIHFAGMENGLVLDATNVIDPGHSGFEYTGAGAISGVAVTGGNEVTLSISGGSPVAGNHVRYAYTGVAGNLGGPITGPRGNLRDNGSRTFLDGTPQWKWCATFDEVL